MTANKVTKEQWLQGALDFIIEQGVFGMTPERLAKSLGTSRSSYYWHFESPEKFRVQVVDYWAETYTDKVGEHLFRDGVTPRERLQKLFNLIHDDGITRYEGAVHALAYGNSALMARIDRAYQTRFEFVRQALSEINVASDKLDATTRLLVCYITWEAEMGACGQSDIVLGDNEFLGSLLN